MLVKPWWEIRPMKFVDTNIANLTSRDGAVGSGDITIVNDDRFCRTGLYIVCFELRLGWTA